MEVGNGRAEGSSAIGDRGQTAVSLMPNTGTPTFTSLKVCNLKRGIYVGDLLCWTGVLGCKEVPSLLRP